MADDVTRYDAVEAYAGSLSYAPGEAARLHVACRAARYSVEVHRWGAARTLMWTADSIAGEDHAVPPDADSVGCGWPVGVEVPIGEAWPSGAYLVTLRAHGDTSDRSTGYAMFVVRAGAAAAVPRARTLLVLATNTWNAYNNWGGCSLYTGGTQVCFDRPFGRGTFVRPEVIGEDRKSPVVGPGDEPDVDGERYQSFRALHGYPGSMSSAGWFTYERRFVEWAERAGHSFDVAVSSDLELRPEVLDGYRLVVCVGHDEYWSAGQRAAVERFVAGGGNLATFSGNTMFWQVRLSPDGRRMECRKYRAHLDDPVVGTPDERLMTGMWCDPLVGRPEWELLGAGSAHGLYSRFGASMPRGAGAFTVYRDDHWMLAGTGLRYGDLLGRDHGVVGYETVGCRITLDDLQLPVPAGGDGTPDDTVIVGLTPSSNLAMGEYPKSIAALDDQGDLEFVTGRLDGELTPTNLARRRHGNAVMLVARPFGDDGGEVVTVGSTDWVYGLDDPLVARVTANVLDRFAG